MDSTRVLVVDDEIDTLNLLKLLLEITGFTPITTLNSVDAIALAESEKPDVVLLDIMMPKIDGFALCKMMRLHPMLKHVPIVFVTAYESLDLEDRRIDAGADEVIRKPIDMDKLTATIETVKEARKAARQGMTGLLQPPTETTVPDATTATPSTATPPNDPPLVAKPADDSSVASDPPPTQTGNGSTNGPTAASTPPTTTPPKTP